MFKFYHDRSNDKLVVGNWMDESFCKRSVILRESDITYNLTLMASTYIMTPKEPFKIGSLGKYDTILADYLIGAVDGFSPYYQDVIVSK